MEDGNPNTRTRVGNPNIWTTSDFWLYNPATATLQLPNGVVYTFGRSVFINDRLGTVAYVTDIHDAFVNEGRIDASAPNGFGHDERSELGCHQVLQRAEKFSGRCADRADPDRPAVQRAPGRGSAATPAGSHPEC